MQPATLLLLVAVLTTVSCASRSSRADDDGRADDTREENVPPPRVSFVGTAGYVFLHRSALQPASRSGAMIGGQIRAHPTSSPHGFVVSALFAQGVFGPTVTILDPAYSYRFIGGRRLAKLTGAGYFDVGPVIAFVSGASPAPTHRVAGVRVSLVLDGYVGPVLVGIAFGYHGGVPLNGPPDAWEGAASVMLRLGFAFDI